MSLTIEELELQSGIPCDVIEQGVAVGLYDNGWMIQRDPEPRFHDKTVLLLTRTAPLLERVRAGEMLMSEFQSILWTIAQAGPDRLFEYLRPPACPLG
jgi:hypothetical protein